MLRSGLMAILIWVVGIAAIAWMLALEPSSELVFGLYSQKRFLALVGTGYSLAWALYLWLGADAMMEKAVRCTLVSGTLLIILTVIESTAFLGLVDYNRISTGGGGIPVGAEGLNPRWWRSDHELIHIRYPHQHIRGRTSGDIRAVPKAAKRIYQIDASYDANGFRNSSDLVRASVVLIGDSFLEAGLIAEQATAAALLHRELGTSVANLGITMYGPQQELAVLRRYGLPLKPRVVLWFFFEGNDASDAARYERHRRAMERHFGRYDSYSHRSFLRNVGNLLTRWTTALRPLPKEQVAHSCDVGEGDEATRLYFRYGKPALDGAETTDGFATAKRVLVEAHGLATQDGVHFALVYVPTKFRVYREQCTDPAKATIPSEWRIDDLPEQMSAWSEEQGMPFLDLTRALQARASGGALLYMSDDSHWTAEGHHVVAQAVLGFLVDRSWLGRE